MSLRDYFIQVARSIWFDNSINGFTSDNVQEAIEEAKAQAEGFPRAGIRSTHNGTVNNLNWIGPNELLPNNPLLVAPINLKINEITWSSSNINVAFRIQFRLNSRTGTIVYTLTVTSPNSGSGFVSNVDVLLNAGQTIHAQYLDDGNNVVDLDLVLWVSRIS